MAQVTSPETWKFKAGLAGGCAWLIALGIPGSALFADLVTYHEVKYSFIPIIAFAVLGTWRLSATVRKRLRP